MRRYNQPREQSRKEISDRLQAKAESELSRANFDARISIGDARDPRLSACTNMLTKEIRANYADSYAEQHPSRVYAFISDAAKHEINHHRYNSHINGYRFKGCPRNLEMSTKLIFEPIVDVISKKGFSLQDAHYLENALEDDILHSDLSPAFSLNGISYFFEEIGRSSPESTFTPFYEAHVKLNLMLMGNAQMFRRNRVFFSKDIEVQKKIQEALKEFLQNSGMLNLAVSFSHTKNQKVLEERLKIREYLNNENNWPTIAKAYAEAFSKLMTPGYAMPLPNHSGAGTKGRESQDASNEGNEFQKQRQTREYKRGRIEEAYSSAEKAPTWIDSFEAKDLLYEGLAKKLAFEVKTFTENTTMPMLHYGERKYYPGTDSLTNITFGFDSQGRMEIRKRPYSIDMQIPVKQSTLGFPKARLIFLDTSGSMKEDFNGGDKIGNTNLVPWGNKSKYHAALVEWYGFLEWLKENHLLERTGIDLVNFSDETLIGKGLGSAKRLALSPQFGMTKLNEAKINEAFIGKNTFIATISDGEISNWNSVSEQFLKGVSDNYYVHLQLGAKNKMCEDIEKHKGHVEVIRTAEELKGRTIRLADKFYRSFRQ